MDQGLVTVIGMSIAYVASFIGMGLAWWAWRRRADEPDGEAGRREAGTGSRPGNSSGTGPSGPSGAQQEDTP